MHSLHHLQTKTGAGDPLAAPVFVIDRFLHTLPLRAAGHVGHFDALRALPEGKGGGAVIRQNPGCVRAVYARSAEELEDADTVERLEALKRFL